MKNRCLLSQFLITIFIFDSKESYKLFLVVKILVQKGYFSLKNTRSHILVQTGCQTRNPCLLDIQNEKRRMMFERGWKTAELYRRRFYVEVKKEMKQLYLKRFSRLTPNKSLVFEKTNTCIKYLNGHYCFYGIDTRSCSVVGLYIIYNIFSEWIILAPPGINSPLLACVITPL